MADDTRHGEETGSAQERAYRRGFRQKSKRDDYALDLFHEARAKLADDPERVGRILKELSRLYNPLIDGPLVDLSTCGRIAELLSVGLVAEAGALLDARYRLYAPIDDAEREGPRA